MNIYIAAPYSCREVAELLAQSMRAAGLDIISTWHQPVNLAQDTLTTDELTACRLHCAAQDNVRQLNAAAVLVLIEFSHAGAGCYWETGYAYRMGIPIHVIQPQRCIYNLLADHTWTRFDTGDMIRFLVQESAAYSLEECLDVTH